MCKHLIKSIAPPENVRVIEERPFSAAVQRGFELGAASSLKWTFCIDADVLILEHGILEQLQLAETLPDHIFCVQGLVLGKFLPIKRPAGNHLYRNALVNQAIPLIPKDGQALRPESVTTQAMKDLGHLTYQTNVVLGLHDYEQYYADIYRKCFLHVNKHEEDLMPRVESYWRQHQARDQDYAVALLGALAGKVYEGTVYIDKQFQEEEAHKMLAISHISEKKTLSSVDYTPEKIQAITDAFQPNEWIQMYKNPRYQENYVRDEILTKPVFLPQKAIKKLLYITSHALTKLGKQIRKLFQDG